MTVVNYIIDNRLVNRLTSNRKWLDSYIPSIAGHVKEQGIDVVFDKDSDYDLMHVHIPMALAYRMSCKNNNGNGTVPKSSDFNNYIRRRFTLINADATLNQRKSA